MRLEAKGRNGQLVYEDGWLTINRKGAVAKMTQGLKGDKRIPVDSITSVQFKPATIATAGYLQIGVKGGSESKGGLQAAVKDENTVVFLRKHQPDFEAVRAAIEGALAGSGNSSGGADVTEQIRKLGELRNQGLLTEEEFQLKKAALLDRM